MRKADALNFIGEGRKAATVFHPVRLQILQRLGQPHSATEIARQLELPRQKVNYHLRELEKAGFVEEVETRRKGNCLERIVRATASHYLVDPSALGSLTADPDQIADRFSSQFLLALASRTIREVAELEGKAAKAKKRIATLSVDTEVRFANAAARNAFASELAQAVAVLVAEYHDEKAASGRPFRLVVASYPSPRSAPRSNDSHKKEGSDGRKKTASTGGRKRN